MKLSFFVFIVLIALPVCADIPSPMPLHRIGYEVLVYATGAAAALGGGLLAGNRKRKVHATTEPIAEWKTEDSVTTEERRDIEVKLESGLPFVKDVFNQRYEELLPKWLAEDKRLPKRYTFPWWVCRSRTSEWKSKNEALLKEILSSDGELVERFTGVPLEYLRDRLMEPIPDEFTAGWFPEDLFMRIRKRREIRLKLVLLVLAVPLIYLAWKLGQM